MNPAEFLKRRKVISVSSEFIVTMLNFASQKISVLCLPVMDAIPEGTEVVGVSSDFYSNRILLAVCNEAFDIVPDGEMPPQISLEDMNWRVVQPLFKDVKPASDSPFQRPFTNPRSGMGVPKS